MKIQPIGERVLVQRDEAEQKTAGGIVLPDAAKEKPQMGKVIAVGNGKLTKSGARRPLQVKAGDRIYFTAWAGDEYKTKDTDYLLMREEDILAVIEK